MRVARVNPVPIRIRGIGATGKSLVMVDPVGDLASRQHLFADELPHERDVLLARKLHRQRYDELPGELCVGAFLEGFHRVPEGLGCAGDGAIRNHVAGPFRRIGRQQEFLVGEVLPGRIVDRSRFGLVAHLRAMAIGGRQHGAAAASARNQPGCEMRDRHGAAGSREQVRHRSAGKSSATGEGRR